MKGHIYILSNPAFSENLYKIGFTTKPIKERASSLSRSTSVPADFKVEYSKEVINVLSAEKRIHMLLEGNRYNTEKEYFLVELKKAIALIRKISNYSNNQEHLSSTYSIHSDLIHSDFNHGLNLNEIKIMRAVMCATIGNSLLEHNFNFKREFVDGFLSVDNVIRILKVKRETASKLLRNVTLKLSSKKVQPNFEGKKILIFNEIGCYRGEMYWIFNNNIRQLFYNEKI